MVTCSPYVTALPVGKLYSIRRLHDHGFVGAQGVGKR